MTNLIQKLQDADSGSRELDAEIATRFGGYVAEHKGFKMVSVTFNGSTMPLPNYSTSIDAALTLVENYDYELKVTVGVDAHCELVNVGTWHEATAKTPPLAITIAALRARQENQE